MSIMSFETIMFIFHSVCMIFFLSSVFTFEKERITVCSSTWKVENTLMFYNSEAFHIVGVVWNTSD